MSLRDWFIGPPPDPEPDDDAPAPAARGEPPRGAGDAAKRWAPPANASAGWSTPVHARDPAPAPREGARFAGHRSADPPVLSVAVLGPAGDAEPVAAAVALALRRIVRARTAAVIVIGGDAPSPDAIEGGTPAARRLAARLAAHGLETSGRGRLAWAHAPPDLVHRPVVADAPAVLAIVAPVTPAIEAAVAGQQLALVVAPDRDGPLAELAAVSLEHLGVPVLATTPLPRGLGRRLALAGLLAPRAIADLLASARSAG